MNKIESLRNIAATVSEERNQDDLLGEIQGICRMALQQPAAVPDGWQLVPVEPTTEMRRKAGLSRGADYYTVSKVWDAMLVAAPAPDHIPEASKMAPEISECQRTAPERIWLQVDPEAMADPETGEVQGSELPFPDDGMSWCADQIGGLEIEYIREDIARNHVADAKKVPLITDAADLVDGQWYWLSSKHPCPNYPVRWDKDKDAFIGGGMPVVYRLTFLTGYTAEPIQPPLHAAKEKAND